MCEHKSFKSFIRLGHFLPAPCGQHLELGQKQTEDSFCVGATSCHFKFEHSFQVLVQISWLSCIESGKVAFVVLWEPFPSEVSAVLSSCAIQLFQVCTLLEQVSFECWFVHSPDWRSSATLGHCRSGTKRSLALVALVEFHHDTTWHLWISLVASMALDTLKELHSMEKVCAKRAVDKIWSKFVST